MPTYEYKCTKCGHAFEAIQSMKDKPLSRCPDCRGSVRRVIHGGMGIIFKGSGFYTTDYKKSSSLSSGNGSSKDKEKGPEKPVEAAGGKTSAEKTTAEKTSSS